MDRKRLTLDNPIFDGKLRYNHRSSAYVRRPAQHLSASGMVDVVVPPAKKQAQPQQQMPAVPRPVQVASTPKPGVSRPALNAMSDLPMPQPKQPKSQSSRSIKRLWKTQNKHTTILYAMAGLLFVAGVAVSWNGLRANRQVAAQVKHTSQTDQSGDQTGPPSTVKPSDAAIRNYAVAPNVPKYLDIPKLKVHTRVLSEGVTKKNELQVPWNIYDVGWYNASAQPGQNGAVLIDGHSGVGAMHGVFYKLASLAAGDALTVTRGDGKTFTYKVVKTQTVNVKDVDMNSTLVSADTSKPGLNLITCTGDQIPGTTELNKRVLVYAIMQ